MKSIYIQNVPARLRICHALLMAFFGPAFSFPTSAHPSLMAIHSIHAIDNADTTITATTEQYIMRMGMVFVLVLMGGFFAGKREI